MCRSYYYIAIEATTPLQYSNRSNTPLSYYYYILVIGETQIILLLYSNRSNTKFFYYYIAIGESCVVPFTIIVIRMKHVSSITI